MNNNAGKETGCEKPFTDIKTPCGLFPSMDNTASIEKSKNNIGFHLNNT